MPLYEYKCRLCGKTIEIIQKIGEAPPKACSHCGGPLRKLISSPAFQFKGEGWYVTDYARKDHPAPKAETDSPAKTGDHDKSKASPPAEKKSASSPAH